MLCRDIIVPCRDNALILYRDNVVIEVSMSRSRWSLQEVRCYNGFGLGWGFFVATEYFYVARELGKGQGFLCLLGEDQEDLCRDIYFDVAIEYVIRRNREF